MSKELELTGRIKVFRCPNCSEFVNLTMEECSFCRSPIDHDAAKVAAGKQETLNLAVNNARYVKILAQTMPAFYGVALIPFMGWIGFWGFLLLAFLVPIMSVRRWVSFGKMQADEPISKRSRHNVKVAWAIWALMLVLFSPILLYHSVLIWEILQSSLM